MSAQDVAYHRKNAVAPAIKATGITGAAGIFVASVQATLTKQNIGAFGAFTRYGTTVATFAAMGGMYEFFRTASANLREQNDSYNEAVGGFFSGAVLGLRFRTMPSILGYGTALAVVMSAFDYTGGSLFGFRRDPTIDEYDRKQGLRLNRRRPIQETIDELGEGRGIFGPGYDERRRERIKARYGIDVPTAQ